MLTALIATCTASAPRPAARCMPLLGLLFGTAVTGTAAADGPEDFFGTYVGVAEVVDHRTSEREQRHMDIVIEPHKERGFRLRWVNVTLVEGERTLPGVKRHVQTVLFEPSAERDLYVETEEGSPFRERRETKPMQGDAVRWAAIDGRRMHVYSFVVLEDGRYEMQIYDRVLTDAGLDIEFQRIVDGAVVRAIDGTTVRAEPGGLEDEE